MLLNLAYNTHYGYRVKVQIGKREQGMADAKSSITLESSVAFSNLAVPQLSASLGSLVDPKLVL
ncbi:MAG: hypothetical protein SGJ00_12160 [bacterium]|nr:hypothetical protein [bacterium]